MKKYILLLLLATLALVSCTDLDEVNSRLDQLETDVKDLKSALEALQRAYDDGKIISRVDPINSETGGWKVTFSDNSTISLLNGADGKDGRDGEDGKDGLNGSDGINGLDYHFIAFHKHPDWVERAHALGMTVNVWTVDQEEEMRYLLDLGVDVITTNKPQLLRSVIQSPKYSR